MAHKTDEEQVEELKRWWEKNGKFVIIAGIVIVASLVGRQAWQNFEVASLSKASAQYQTLMDELESGQLDSVTQRAKTLEQGSADLVYSVLAALAAAKAHVEKGDNEAAADQLRWALENAKTEKLKHVVRLRLAKVLIAQGKLDEALTHATVPQQGTFSSQYSIVKGDIYLKKAEIESAKTAYRAALSDTNLGPQMRNFVQTKLDDLGGSGDEASL